MDSYFPEVTRIEYEGRDSSNPLSFRWYDKDRVVAGKKIRDHLRFAVAYWHTLCGTGGDPFGRGTKAFPWLTAAAQRSLYAASTMGLSKYGSGRICWR